MATSSDEVRDFVMQAPTITEVDLTDIHEDGALGPAGADLDSPVPAEAGEHAGAAAHVHSRLPAGGQIAQDPWKCSLRLHG